MSVAAPHLFDQVRATGPLIPPGFTPLLIGLIVAGVLGLVAVAVLNFHRMLRARRIRVADQFGP